MGRAIRMLSMVKHTVFTKEMALADGLYPRLIGFETARDNWNRRSNYEMIPVRYARKATWLIGLGILSSLDSSIRIYADYKASKLWRDVRTRIFARARGRCACCTRKAEEVHHRDYRLSVLRGDRDEYLVALCKVCHGKVHAADPKFDDWDDQERVLAGAPQGGRSGHPAAHRTAGATRTRPMRLRGVGAGEQGS